MIKTILITGGTGLLGTELVRLLIRHQYVMHLLVRDGAKVRQSQNLKVFNWDIYNNKIDPACIQGVDAIIHLAGEEIAARRWTDERKKQIVESRTKSIRMIYSLMRETKHQVAHVISASAVGYYGDRGNELLRESSLPAKDFLAETCIAWEEAVHEGDKLGLRVVKLRSGIILDKNGGLLPQLARTMKFDLAVIPGTGKQWVSWIHLQDAAEVYLHALRNQEIKGVYNMAAPELVSLDQLAHCLAAALRKSPLFAHAPKFALKLAMGEMSLMVLASTKVTANKLKSTGFTFGFPNIQEAMFEIYNRK